MQYLFSSGTVEPSGRLAKNDMCTTKTDFNDVVEQEQRQTIQPRATILDWVERIGSERNITGRREFFFFFFVCTQYTSQIILYVCYKYIGTHTRRLKGIREFCLFFSGALQHSKGEKYRKKVCVHIFYIDSTYSCIMYSTRCTRRILLQ